MTLPNGCKVWLALGADLSRSPGNWTWTDVTSYVLHDNGAGVTVDIGYPEIADDASPTRITFTANNQDGRWSPTNPAGAWFGQIDIDTPVKVTFDPGSGAVDRGIAHLTDLPLEWTPGGKFRYVRIEALGRLSRMDGADDTTSNARRTAMFWGPLAYWPGEEPSGASRIVSAIAGQPNGSLSGFSATAEFAGSEALPVWTADSHADGAIAPYVRPQPEAWGAVFALTVPERPASSTQLFAVRMLEPLATLRYVVVEMSSTTPAVIYLRAYTAAGAELLADTGVDFSIVPDLDDHEPFGERLAVSLGMEQSGADITWSMTVWGESGTGQGTGGTLASNALGPLVAWSSGPVATMSGWSLAHFAFYSSADLAGAVASTIASANTGDPACQRFVLQAAMDASVQADTSDDTAGPPMGPVPTASQLEVLRECATLDGGLFWEKPDGTLYLLHLGDMADQSVAMTVDYSDLRDLRPTSAARDFVNRIKVSRSGAGGPGVTVDASGPLSPTARGVVRSKSLTVNAQDDSDLPYYGQWATALGTVQDYRYTAELQFHGAASASLATWLSRNVGDRVQITNPPAWLPPGTIDGYVRGYTEHFSRFEYDLSLRLLPYRPYLSWTVEGSGNTGRADTSGSRLMAAITSSGTSAIVGTYGNPTGPSGIAVKWSTASVPYDLAIRAAERVTCTAVTNNAPTFVAAGTASHGDAADLTPALPAGLTVGDLVLCLAAIRTVDGIMTETTGTWTRLPVFGRTDNVAMFAATYSSGMAAPTISFGGAIGAGDTTSAQTCAFRYLQPFAHAFAIRNANAAAGNIATPGLIVQRNGCVIIAAGWKQDDWTSVATLAGFTEIGEPSSTTGNDQGLVWDYQIQTTATNIAATSFTVTGGTSQISKAGVVAILGDCQTLTLTRNVNSISGGVAHPAGSEVNLWRGGVVRRP